MRAGKMLTRDGGVFIQGTLFFMLILLMQTPTLGDLSKRWVYLSGNLYVDNNLPKIESVLERAKKAGYNGVLFSDYKTFTWWQLEDAPRWRRNARRLRETTRKLEMELVVCVFPFGYADSLLWHDVNLASGMPIKDAPLQRIGDRLKPVETAAVTNGSFEAHQNNQAMQYAFQDDPGRGSFMDSAVKKEGAVSLRFENVGQANPHGNARICQKTAVKPWQHYRLRVWMKTEDLTGGEIKLLVMADGRVLQWQHLQIRPDGQYRYIDQVSRLTSDWVEQCVTFNSLQHDSVMIYAGIWGGRTGSIWWDDLRIEAVPALNILRRDSLPVTITGANGELYEEGVDFDPIVDPQLGQTPWPGSYDTRHDAPAIKTTPQSRIKEGQTVLLSGYHPVLVYSGQINCSLSEPKVFDLCRQQIVHTEDALQPDGYMMSHDEIRCAGWEPQQIKRFGSAGELLAFNVRTCSQILHEMAPDKTIYIWSDMFDPFHNAVDDFYLVHRSLAGSWEGLDQDIVVMKWGGGQRAAPGLKFFADRGHPQMIAGYYDSPVATDHAMWSTAMKGVPNVTGVMYTTWENDYSDLEAFASAWWD